MTATSPGVEPRDEILGARGRTRHAGRRRSISGAGRARQRRWRLTRRPITGPPGGRRRCQQLARRGRGRGRLSATPTASARARSTGVTVEASTPARSCVDVIAPLDVLRHATWIVGEGRDLRRGGSRTAPGDRSPSPAERLADRRCRPPRRCRRRPRRSTSVGGPPLSTRRSASIVRDELAAGRDLGERPGGLARVRGQQERRRVARPSSVGSPARPRRGQLGAGIASSRSRALDRSDASGSAAAGVSARPAGRRRRRSARAAAAARPRAGGVRSSWPSSSASRSRDLGAVRHDLVQGLAVLAPQLDAGSWRRPRTSSRRSGSLLDRPRPRLRSVVHDVVELGAQAAQPRRPTSANGARSVEQRRPRRRARSSAGLLDRQCVGGARAGLAVRAASASSVLARSRGASSSAGSSIAAASISSTLVPEQVDLARLGTLVAAEPVELGLELARTPSAARAARPASTRRRRSGRARARCSAGASSVWCACWPCRSTSSRPEFGELAGGRQAAVDVGAAAAVARGRPARARPPRRSRGRRTGPRPAPRRRRRAPAPASARPPRSSSMRLDDAASCRRRSRR